MANADVGPSRDGDHFHYSRASRLCLELLNPGSDLEQVTVEGVSTKEEIDEGIESIDLALYYGDNDPDRARRVCYRQLKHSTLRPDEPWTSSGLKKTLRDFATRYKAFVAQYGQADVAARFRFEFETNRPIDPGVLDALGALASGRIGTAGKTEKYLIRVIGLRVSALPGFLDLFRPITRVDGFLKQRQLLGVDFSRYLPDGDKDAAVNLWSLVSRKATSEFKSNPAIRLEDVLDAVGATMRDLFPAPAALELPPAVVPRVQFPDLVATVRSARHPVIVTANSGEGKSIVASQLGAHLPGCRTFLFDCFGNGAYRSASGYRHRARDGLVQFANEMAATGLCDPLIPTSKADDAAYVRAFLGRVAQASTTLKDSGPAALLVLVIDAADNAETAAEEVSDPPSFPRLLLAESFPSNVRLVLTARPYRIAKLNPGPSVIPYELHPFTDGETRLLLEESFGSVTEQHVREFHRVTMGNPRVQRAALEAATTLPEVLAALGPTPRSADDAIGELLEAAVDKVRYGASRVEQSQIDRICMALAMLRPFVPLSVVAATADVPHGLVRSLVHDLARPLMIRDDAIQFRDEPTETWFQERFRPTPTELGHFLTRLAPLASTSAYVAAALPALMLTAGQFDALVGLALTGQALPTADTIARRDVELQRLEFAIRAALKAGRYPDATKLLLKAGGEVAAGARQQELLSANTDLAARFLSAPQLMEQVSRRLIKGGKWRGSEHAYEAALLSGHPALAGDALAQLRVANRWLQHWSRRDRTRKGPQETISYADIVELLWAELNLNDAASCAGQLRGWRPRAISFRVGRLLARRMVDAGRWSDLDALAHAAGNDVGLVLAVALELDEAGRHLPLAPTRRAVRLVSSRRLATRSPADWREEGVRVLAATALAFSAHHHGIGSGGELAAMIRLHLPESLPSTISSDNLGDDRFAYLRTYALLAELTAVRLQIDQFAPALRAELEKKHSHDSEVARLRRNVVPLLPWHVLAVQVRLGSVAQGDVPQHAKEALEGWASGQRHPHRGWSCGPDEVALLWADIAMRLQAPDAQWRVLADWAAGLKQGLYVPTYATLARRVACTDGPTEIALEFVDRGRTRSAGEAEMAESMAETHVLLARAILLASPDEARQYFEEAIRVAAKIGQENAERWDALLHLAEAAPGADAKLSHRFTRAAELTRSFIDRDKHFPWEHTVDALVTLSPRSAPAVISRWNDRRFGSEERVLTPLVEALCRRRELEPRDAIALLTCDGYWDWPGVIDAALRASRSSQERTAIADFAHSYLRFAVHSSDRLNEIARVFTAHGVDPARIQELAQRETVLSAPSSAGTPGFTAGRDDEPDWHVVFSGLDVTQVEDLRTSLARLAEGGRPGWRERWTQNAVNRVAAGRERAFIEGYGAVVEPSAHTFAVLLRAVPQAWESRLSAKDALGALARRVCDRDAASINVSRIYQTLPLDLVTQKTGTPRDEIIREVLGTSATTSLPRESHGIFRLAALSAKVLPVEDARAVLEFGLDLLEGALDDEHGDGPWRDALQSAPTAASGMAGYIWAALGAVEAPRRWRAAHAVRGWFRLGRVDMIDALIAHAGVLQTPAYSDVRLHFYHLHALQWLLLALQRAAAENGPVAARYAPWLQALASRSNRHVVIRSLAANALLELAGRQLHALTTTERADLVAINRPALPIVHARGHRPTSSRDATGYRANQFSFDYDFQRSWVEPVARQFSMSADQIEGLTREVIEREWGRAFTGRFDEDARAARGYFESQRRSHRATGSQDDLSFYLSFHALMMVIGELLESHAVYEDPKDPTDSLEWWLRGKSMLTRRDGRWIADIRQLPPEDCLRFPDEDAASWPQPIKSAYMDRRLVPTEDAVVVSGIWHQYRDRSAEMIHIESALVAPSRVDALGHALASAQDPRDVGLPRFGDRAEMRHGRYVLDGWISDVGNDPGIDAQDPWAGSVMTRGVAPAQAIVERLGLVPDAGDQLWRQPDGRRVLWIEVWGEPEGEAERSPPDGYRLVADRIWLDQLLETTSRTMILQMTCRRSVLHDYDRHTPRGDSERQNELTEYYILDRDTGPTRVPRGNGTG